MQNKLWCERVMIWEDIETKNIREDEFNPILGYSMVRNEILHKTCTR